MSSQPVFALACSRLHADIAIIRLIRAGIGIEKVSAVFPRRRAPNSVCCWLKNFSCLPLTSSLPLAAAGLLGRLFQHRKSVASLERELETLGLSPELARRILEEIGSGSIVLCVHACNHTQAAIARHVFRTVGAEEIISSDDHADWTPHRGTLVAPQPAGLAA